MITDTTMIKRLVLSIETSVCALFVAVWSNMNSDWRIKTYIEVGEGALPLSVGNLHGQFFDGQGGLPRLPLAKDVDFKFPADFYPCNDRA